MKWFTAKSIEELKRQYKKLATKWHPDICRRDTEMKQINAEYDVLFEQLKDIHETADGKTYTANESTTETADEYKDIIDALIHLDGILIEICGSWIWVTGNTYPNRKELKELNFKFSRSKTAWYFHSSDYRKKNKKTYTLNEIRDLYGSESIKAEPQLKLKLA